MKSKFSDIAQEWNQSNNKKTLRLEKANLTYRFPDKDISSEADVQKVATQWHFKITLASVLDWTHLTISPHPHSSNESVALVCHGIMDNFCHLSNIFKAIKLLFSLKKLAVAFFFSFFFLSNVLYYVNNLFLTVSVLLVHLCVDKS